VLEPQTEQTGVAFREHMASSEMTAVPELGRTLGDRGPEHISWSAGFGVRFDDHLVAVADFDRESNQNVPRISLRGPVAVLSWELPVVWRSRPDAHALHSCRPARRDHAT
jgi:hypothetical protein